MGMDINTILIKTTNVNKQYYLQLIGRYGIDSKNVSNIEGYEILHIDNEDIECFKIGEEIAKKYNAITISLFSYDSDFAGFQLVDENVIIRITLNKNIALTYDYFANDQNIELLLKYVNNKYSLNDIKDIINEEYTFADEGLEKLLLLMDIDYNKIII